MCGVQRAGLIVRNSSCFCQGRWVDLGSVVQVSWGRRWTEMLLARLAVVDIPLYGGVAATIYSR